MILAVMLLKLIIILPLLVLSARLRFQLNTNSMAVKLIAWPVGDHGARVFEIELITPNPTDNYYASMGVWGVFDQRGYCYFAISWNHVKGLIVLNRIVGTWVDDDFYRLNRRHWFMPLVLE